MTAEKQKFQDEMRSYHITQKDKIKQEVQSERRKQELSMGQYIRDCRENEEKVNS